MRILKVISILFFFVCGFVAVAQNQDISYRNIKFKNYSTKDGLSQRSVTNIFQDKKGFLWFGTRYGLNRFDGDIFKNYNYNSEDINSLGHNWITKIVNDFKGNIWVGTKKGLNTYIPEEDNFKRVRTPHLNNEFYNEEIWDLKAQDTSFLWIATNNGIDRFSTETGEFLRLEHNVNTTNSLSSNKTRALMVDNQKHVWIATTEAIDLYNPNANSFKHFEYPKGLNPTTTKNNSIVLFQDTKGKIWLGYNNGLSFFDTEKKRFIDFEFNSKTIIKSSVRSICEDRDGNLWIGTYEGLFEMEFETGILYKYEHDITNQNSLSQNSIYSIFEDNRGDLWVGTWAAGVSYYDKSSSNFTTFSAGYTKKNLNYNVVSSFAEDKKGNFWIATEGGGLNYYNKKTGDFSYFTSKLPQFKGLQTNNIKVILKDYKGNLWIGMHRGGIGYLNVNNDFNYVTFKNNTSYKYLKYSNISAIEEDVNHNLWIGTNKEGLSFFDGHTRKFSKVKDSLNSIGEFIYTIQKSKYDNSVFVGSENGLSKINILSKKIKKIDFIKQSDKGAFNLNSVISIYQESPSSLWIGTEGDGLYNFNFKTSESVHYGLKQGLPNELIYGILDDENGNIWLSTNKGLCQLNLETKQVKNYYESDGIQADEFNYEAYYKSTKGDLFFGGINGFTVFNPKKIKRNNFIPPVGITLFNVRNNTHTIVTDATKQINLEYNENDFSFDFVALDYSQPNKNQYAYMLEGFDTDWNFVKNSRMAVYTNINPGNYVFRVKASNSDGVWNEKGQSIELNITPPFWKTWWAYCIYSILALGVFYLIRKYTLLRIKDKNDLKQERLDKEQMEEVNRLKLQLFTNISHDFRTPLTLIIGPLKKMINDKVGNNYVQNQLTNMYRNASILLQLINQLLDFRKSEAGKLHLHTSKYNIVTFIKEIQLLFEEFAKDRDIKFYLESPEDVIDVWFDKIEMKKVILNVLSNAFKFTPKHGEISIKVSYSKSNNNDALKPHVKIQITDSGKGIRNEDIEYVFDRYFQLGQKNELRSGTGVGLALAKDIIQLHKGEIYVESNLGKGSSFTIILPLGKEHLSKDEILDGDYKPTTSIDYYEAANVKSGWIREENIAKEISINELLPNILLVEDNAEVRGFIKEIFIDEFNVYEAENGEEGIHAAQIHSIDVIVSDLMMPEMDGLEMCNKIKSDIRTSHIPVILLTARTSSKVQKKGYETGADVYLTKPFNSETLKLQVLNILKSRNHLIDKFKKDILLEPNEITVVSTDEAFLKKAMEVIENNLSNTEFNVNSFIDKMFMSQSVVYRKIKVLTGQSISEFIRSVRLKKASQLLLMQTNATIASIAYDVGFNDIKYFRKCFKAAFHKTPSAYRKEHLEAKK